MEKDWDKEIKDNTVMKKEDVVFVKDNEHKTILGFNPLFSKTNHTLLIQINIHYFTSSVHYLVHNTYLAWINNAPVRETRQQTTSN